MGYNFKSIRAAVKFFLGSSRPNRPENACQKSWESNRNWGIYGQKETSYVKEPFLPVPLLK